MGVLSHLQAEMGDLIPTTLKSAKAGMPNMPPKAYRWVREMQEIAATHAEEGGFDDGVGKSLFMGVAEVYKAIAEDTVLGDEKTERRVRGKTAEDVAAAVGEGLQTKNRKLVVTGAEIPEKKAKEA